ncbi:hypothetical protein F4677DRAFT_462863 [Hypoxylon crocopeplum]|nr:hypothetical protein F4677DRAFT_462863 [Hypoxylon crocopeplum]
MASLSALALAGNVLQFIEFITKLLSRSVEVYKSTTGTSRANLALEEICEQLSAFCDSLRDGSKETTRTSASETALRGIADLCSADCAGLLAALNDLKVKDGNHRAWKSIRAALKLAWKGEHEIEKLIDRLRGRQSAMTLHICALSNTWLQNLNGELRHHEEQNRALQLQHLDRLNEISSYLQDIKQKIDNSTSSGPDCSFSAADIHDLTHKISHVSIAERNIAKEQAILASLDYKPRPERRENIADAHARTFSWVFETPDQEATSNQSLLKWLRESDGVFWVSGKPGSGKSTFMKFLVNHSKTRDALQLWAAPGKLVTASHFFWSQGVSLQKSAKGLFQSLLYDIFRQCPELIAKACPSRWETTNQALQARQDWTLKELVDCFQVIKANSTSAQKLQSSIIKLCVASRPLNEFLDQFGGNSSSILPIHELTWNDILKYARSRLQEHPRWSVLGLDVQAAQSFLEKIANTARGVFLWVTLVTQSLRNGLTNDDTMEDLNARLDSLPKSLEAFYKQMLDSVDPIYHRKSADLLQMLVQVIQDWPMPWLIAYIHEREYTDPDYAITMPRTTLTPSDVNALRKRTSRRLNAKCRGIVEIQGRHLVFIHRTAWDYLRTPEMADYIRTRSGEGYNAKLSMLRAYAACLKLGIAGITKKRSLARWEGLRVYSEITFDYVFRLAKSARDGGVGNTAIFKLIDYLESLLISTAWPDGGGDLECLDVWSTPVGDMVTPLRVSPMLHPMIWACEVDYAAAKLASNMDYFRAKYRPALRLLLVDRSIIHRNDSWCPSSLKFLHLLLNNGYSPNDRFLEELSPCLELKNRDDPWEKDFGDSINPEWELIQPPYGRDRTVSSSPWLGFLIGCNISGCFGPRRQVESALHYYCDNYYYTRHGSDWNFFNSGLEHGIFSLLLRHGADSNAHLSPFTTAWVDFICFAIKHPSRITATKAYLETLDDFFKYGADLGASTIGLTLRPGDTASHLPFRLVTGWDTFCEALEDLTEFEREKELEFISQITTKIIKQAARVQWPLGRLPSVIAKIFREELSRPMLNIISGSQVRTEILKSQSKRLLEGAANEGEGKRLKPLSAEMGVA